jgi:protein-S-isoprenylcysteine O-methyltransferase Ste14
MSIPGAFFLIFLAVCRLAWMIQHGPTPLGVILFAQAGLAGILMIYRRPADITAPKQVEIIAWLSAALPLSFSTPASGGLLWLDLLPVPGLILNLWALISLGSVFGISPAHRGLVTSGPYHWLRHPMYAGELLSLLGGLLAAFRVWNLVILLVFAASLIWRIHWEEHVLNRNGYFAYARHIRWRLIPGIW